jgi:hypothetical protein
MKKSAIDVDGEDKRRRYKNSSTNMYVRLPEMKTAWKTARLRRPDEEISSDINRDTRHSATLSNETPESPLWTRCRCW